MTGERWERLTAIFHDALAASPAEREALLDRACAGDPALRAEIERLLSAHQRAGGFIETSPLAEPSLEGRRFGAYRIVREIGRGGMGAVYLAERADGQFEQRVAVKLIKRGMDTDQVLERFRAERQILASLEHPNIARLLDGGTADGLPYFVMEYIEGEAIDRYAESRALRVPERLRLFLGVCNAVAYAHGHRVIHRDIKPMNILVTADGTPKLLDFGIAKVLDPAGGQTTGAVTGFRLLTPEYASPEQVEGRAATSASDVYSLGVVLYELLTGLSPYRTTSGDPLAVVEAVRSTDPEPPSVVVEEAALGRMLRGDLDTIVMTALRKDPARRYGSVELLAADIRRHLEGMPVQARPDGLMYRSAKFVRRNRPAVLAAALAGLAVFAGALILRRLDDARPGLLAPRDRVLVADFADQAGDPPLTAAVTDAFRVDLTQSPLVRVISQRQVRSTLTQMQRSPDLTLDDSLAREVAARQNVQAIVTGSFARVAGRYSISLQLVAAASGELLGGWRETVSDSADVIRAVGRLSEQLRRRIGESAASLEASPPLLQVTTGSLDALRAYTDGVRLINGGKRAAGIKRLVAAVALDTGFASAWRVLGVTYGDMVESGLAGRALAHAVANQSRLPFYERYHLVATRAYSMLEDYPAAIEAYHKLLERYPDDVRALNNLGYVHSLRREFAAQESLLVRAAAADSTISLVQTGLVTARINAGNYDAARAELSRVEERFPGLLQARLAEIYLAASRQDWDAAERQARARLAADPADTLDALDGLETLAGILETRGRLSEAEAASWKVLELSARIGSPGRYLSSALRLAYIELRYRHAAGKALALVEAAVTRFSLDSLSEGDRPWDDLARFYAEAGRPDSARALLERAERTRTVRLSGSTANRQWSLGVIAFAEGKLAEAEAELSQAAATLYCPICTLPDLARAYEAAQKPDSAVAVYQRYVELPWEWRFETDATELGRSLGQLGRLYEQRREAGKARGVYTRLAKLWARADPELQPEVAAARRRAAKLAPVPGP